MRVAELFAELGFKITGDDEAALKGFETTLLGIAAAARDAAAALKELAGVKLPKEWKVPRVPPMPQGVATPPSAPALAAPTTPGPRLPPPPRTIPSGPTISPQPNYVVPAPTPSGPPPPPRATPLPPPPTFMSSVLQGLKSFGVFAKGLASITLLGMAIKKLISVIQDWIRTVMERTLGTSQTTTLAEIDRKVLKQFELLGASAGMASEEIQAQMQTLAQRAAQIRWTGQGIAPQTGVNQMQSPDRVLVDFARRFEKMSARDQVFWAQQLGIDSKMVYALREHGKVLNDSRQAAFIVTDQEQKRNLALTTDINKLKFAWKQTMEKLSALLAPIGRVLVQFTTALVKAFGQIVSFAGSVWNLGSDLDRLEKTLNGWIDSLVDALDSVFSWFGGDKKDDPTSAKQAPMDKDKAAQALSPDPKADAAVAAPPLPESVQAAYDKVYNYNSDFTVNIKTGDGWSPDKARNLAKEAQAGFEKVMAQTQFGRPIATSNQ